MSELYTRDGVNYSVNPIIKLQIDYYCLKLSLEYEDNIVKRLYEKVYYAFYKDERFVRSDTTFVLQHLITVASNKLERDLLRGLLKYMHSFLEKPLYT